MSTPTTACPRNSGRAQLLSIEFEHQSSELDYPLVSIAFSAAWATVLLLLLLVTNNVSRKKEKEQEENNNNNNNGSSSVSGSQKPRKLGRIEAISSADEAANYSHRQLATQAQSTSELLTATSGRSTAAVTPLSIVPGGLGAGQGLAMSDFLSTPAPTPMHGESPGPGSYKNSARMHAAGMDGDSPGGLPNRGQWSDIDSNVRARGIRCSTYDTSLADAAEKLFGKLRGSVPDRARSARFSRGGILQQCWSWLVYLGRVSETGSLCSGSAHVRIIAALDIITRISVGFFLVALCVSHSFGEDDGKCYDLISEGDCVDHRRWAYQYFTESYSYCRWLSDTDGTLAQTDTSSTVLALYQPQCMWNDSQPTLQDYLHIIIVGFLGLGLVRILSSTVVKEILLWSSDQPNSNFNSNSRWKSEMSWEHIHTHTHTHTNRKGQRRRVGFGGTRVQHSGDTLSEMVLTLGLEDRTAESFFTAFEDYRSYLRKNLEEDGAGWTRMAAFEDGWKRANPYMLIMDDTEGVYVSASEEGGGGGGGRGRGLELDASMDSRYDGGHEGVEVEEEEDEYYDFTGYFPDERQQIQCEVDAVVSNTIQTLDHLSRYSPGTARFSQFLLKTFLVDLVGRRSLEVGVLQMLMDGRYLQSIVGSRFRQVLWRFSGYQIWLQGLLFLGIVTGNAAMLYFSQKMMRDTVDSVQLQWLWLSAVVVALELFVVEFLMCLWFTLVLPSTVADVVEDLEEEYVSILDQYWGVDQLQYPNSGPAQVHRFDETNGGSSSSSGGNFSGSGSGSDGGSLTGSGSRDNGSSDDMNASPRYAEESRGVDPAEGSTQPAQPSRLSRFSNRFAIMPYPAPAQSSSPSAVTVTKERIFTNGPAQDSTPSPAFGSNFNMAKFQYVAPNIAEFFPKHLVCKVISSHSFVTPSSVALGPLWPNYSPLPQRWLSGEWPPASIEAQTSEYLILWLANACSIPMQMAILYICVTLIIIAVYFVLQFLPNSSYSTPTTLTISAMVLGGSVLALLVPLLAVQAYGWPDLYIFPPEDTHRNKGGASTKTMSRVGTASLPPLPPQPSPVSMEGSPGSRILASPSPSPPLSPSPSLSSSLVHSRHSGQERERHTRVTDTDTDTDRNKNDDDSNYGNNSNNSNSNPIDTAAGRAAVNDELGKRKKRKEEKKRKEGASLSQSGKGKKRKEGKKRKDGASSSQSGTSDVGSSSSSDGEESQGGEDGESALGTMTTQEAQADVQRNMARATIGTVLRDVSLLSRGASGHQRDGLPAMRPPPPLQAGTGTSPHSAQLNNIGTDLDLGMGFGVAEQEDAHASATQPRLTSLKKKNLKSSKKKRNADKEVVVVVGGGGGGVGAGVGVEVGVEDEGLPDRNIESPLTMSPQQPSTPSANRCQLQLSALFGSIDLASASRVPANHDLYDVSSSEGSGDKGYDSNSDSSFYTSDEDSQANVLSNTRPPRSPTANSNSSSDSSSHSPRTSTSPDPTIATRFGPATAGRFRRSSQEEEVRH